VRKNWTHVYNIKSPQVPGIFLLFCNIMDAYRINVRRLMSDSLGFGTPAMDMLESYEEPHKLYHNLFHIKEMLHFVSQHKGDMTPDEYRALQAAIIFHDIVYATAKYDENGLPVAVKDNEEKSVEAFKKAVGTLNDIQTKQYWDDRTPLVEKLIMATKKHDFHAATSRAEQLIILADLDRFNEPNFERFWGYTLQLFKEYCHVEFDLFKQGRIDFLDSYADKLEEFMPPLAVSNLRTLIPALKAWHPTIAVYPGSFNPFHQGHRNILEKAEAIFDKVIIAKGVNPEKYGHEHWSMPEEILQGYQVDTYEGMLTDYIATKNYPVTVIRGLRNSTDLQYELNQYRHLQDLMPNIKVVSIFCDAQYEHVSSSSIRTFHKYGKESKWKI
jgi:pantetheine-phosphate adenylyltransferase